METGTINFSLSNLIQILLTALCAAGLEMGLHYYFHPSIRQPPGKLRSYVLGSLAWVGPLMVLFALNGGWFYGLAAVIVLTAAGLVTWLANEHDYRVEITRIAEDESQQRQLLEGQANDKNERFPRSTP